MNNVLLITDGQKKRTERRLEWMRHNALLQLPGAIRPLLAQTTVEFAFVVTTFFLLLLASLDYGQLYFYRQSMEHAMRQAGRAAIIGGILTTNVYPSGTFPNLTLTTGVYKSSYSSGNTISRNETIRNVFTHFCAINFSPTNLLVYSWPGANNATEASPNLGPGLAQDYIKLQCTYSLQLVTPMVSWYFPNGKYNITVQNIFYAEPFATGYTNRYSGEP